MSAAQSYRPLAPTRWGDWFWMRRYRTDDETAIAKSSRGSAEWTTGLTGYDFAPSRHRDSDYFGETARQWAAISLRRV